MLVLVPFVQDRGLPGTPCAPAKAGAQYWVPAFAGTHDWLMSLAIRTEHAWGDGGRGARCTLSLNVDLPRYGSRQSVAPFRASSRGTFSKVSRIAKRLPLCRCRYVCRWGASHWGDGCARTTAVPRYGCLSDPGRSDTRRRGGCIALLDTPRHTGRDPGLRFSERCSLSNPPVRLPKASLGPWAR
jgi:hypothetical protein